jgi:hypothetical protein
VANYSNARRLSGISGDVVLDTSKRFYIYDEPCAQFALIILHTKRGTSRANPKLGVDWDKVERGSESMAASGERAIAEGFKPWAALVKLESARVEEGPLGRLLVEVVVSDPRRPSSKPRTVNTSIR